MTYSCDESQSIDISRGKYNALRDELNAVIHFICLIEHELYAKAVRHDDEVCKCRLAEGKRVGDVLLPPTPVPELNADI